MMPTPLPICGPRAASCSLRRYSYTPSPSEPPYSFGHVSPSQPRSPSVAHERAPLGRVDDLGHVLAGQVEDVGVVVLVEELLDLLGERALLGREIEVHAPDCTRRAATAARPGNAVRR